MSKQSAARKIQRKAKRRAKRKLPVAGQEPVQDSPEEEKTFDPVKDSPGGE